MIDKKILFILPDLNGGGAQRAIISLLKQIDRKKFKNYLIVCNSTNSTYNSQIPRDIEYIDLKSGRVRSSFYKLFITIKKLKPDLVISTIEHMNVALGILKFFLPKNIIFIARESNIITNNLSQYNFPYLWFFLIKFFYKRFNGIISISNNMKEDLINNFNIPTSKIKNIYNPYDILNIQNLAKEKIDNEENYLISKKNHFQLIAAGALTKQKGFDILIKAISKIKDKSIFLTILGAGPLREKLVKLSKKNGLSNKIQFIGFEENPYKWFKKADLFVLSSIYEGDASNVAIESLICETPVLALPSPGGIKEILSKISATVFVEDMTSDALSKSISIIMNSDKIKVNISEMNFCDAKKITQEYEKYFDQFI